MPRSFAGYAFAWAVVVVPLLAVAPPARAQIGSEKAIPTHMEDGEEFTVSLEELLAHGKLLMNGAFTVQEGQGRPLTKGSG
ncbi:MAG: hypothetical protein ACREQY_08735, partial [Candidatus Binatia bacterium]